MKNTASPMQASCIWIMHLCGFATVYAANETDFVDQFYLSMVLPATLHPWIHGNISCMHACLRIHMQFQCRWLHYYPTCLVKHQTIFFKASHGPFWTPERPTFIYNSDAKRYSFILHYLLSYYREGLKKI